MADIYLAHDPQLAGVGELLVVKRLHEDKQDQEHYVAALVDEANLLRRLDHDNIVRFLDLGEVDGCDYLVLEYIWGESLTTLSKLCVDQRRCIPADLAIHICAEVAVALHHAHTRQDAAGGLSPIIHRDVTLSNVMVTHSGRVKVLDFGIAMAEERLARTRSGMVKGTLVYLAPEQILSDEVSPQTDIYQLGVLLYKLLVGIEPFEQTELESVLLAIVRGDIIKPSGRVPSFPRSVARVLDQAMARLPSQRHPSAAALEAALRSLLGMDRVEGRQGLAKWIGELAGERRERQLRYVRELLEGLPATEDAELPVSAYAERSEPSVVYVEYSELFAKGALFEDGPSTSPEAEESVRMSLAELQQRALRAVADKILDADETTESGHHLPSTRAIRAVAARQGAPTLPALDAVPTLPPISKAGWREGVAPDYFGSDTEIETQAPDHMDEQPASRSSEGEPTMRLPLPETKGADTIAEQQGELPAAPVAEPSVQQPPAATPAEPRPAATTKAPGLFEDTDQVSIEEDDFHARSTHIYTELETEDFDTQDTIILDGELRDGEPDGEP